MTNPIADPLVEGADSETLSDTVVLEATPSGVAVVTINRPARKNAFNAEVIAALTQTFETLRGVHFVSAHRERLEKARDLLDRNVIDNTERGLQLSLGDVARAHVEQTKLYRRALAFFQEVDVLICPAASVSPFPHSQMCVEEINGEKMPTYMRWLALSYAPTMALACAVALPCGVDHLGLPFGIQVIGPNGGDARVLQVAHALEQVLGQTNATSRPVPNTDMLAILPSE